MKIQIEVDIFDDPIYCSNDKSECVHVYYIEDDETRCSLFQYEYLVFDATVMKYRKTEKCKRAWDIADAKRKKERNLLKEIDNLT